METRLPTHRLGWFEELLLSVTLPYVAQEHANVIPDRLSLAKLLRQCLKMSPQFHVFVMMLQSLKCSLRFQHVLS